MIPVLNPVDLIESALNGFRSTASTAPSLPGPAKRLKVLVADDAITSRMLFRNILASHGFEVSIASDGEAALQLLKSEHFDLVVTDIQMPRFDGLQLTREIRRDPILGSIPVILITSMGSREEIQRGVEAGADAYFVKSKFDQENLLATIRRLI
jgi:two-component system chemotaxis sensor kinase CheA